MARIRATWIYERLTRLPAVLALIGLAACLGVAYPLHTAVDYAANGRHVSAVITGSCPKKSTECQAEWVIDGQSFAGSLDPYERAYPLGERVFAVVRPSHPTRAFLVSAVHGDEFGLATIDVAGLAMIALAIVVERSSRHHGRRARLVAGAVGQTRG